MSLVEPSALTGATAIGRRLDEQPLPAIMPLMRELWPICRSLTGPGVRQTLDILGRRLLIERFREPSGSQVLDWIVPPEWQIRDAYILDETGHRVVDFRDHNLHVLGYSVPVDVSLTLEELQAHLYSIPEAPDAIPYLTSYYRQRWGFCLTHRARQALGPGRYRCVIDSTLDPHGHLDYGQTRIAGRTEAEILFSSYICHPSMANNELSGPCTQAALFSVLQELAPSLRLSYRAAWTTETLGTLCFLNRFGSDLTQRLVGGAVISCVGDDGPITWVGTRRGKALMDRVVPHILAHVSEGKPVDLRPWHPVGSDERQYCSPGYDLPVGLFLRSHYDRFPQYHTSLDNLDFVSESALQFSLQLLLRICQALEMNVVPRRTNPCGEPQLGRRNLYDSHRTNVSDWTERMLFLLAFADGDHDLLAIAERAGKPIWAFLDPLLAALDAELLFLDSSTS